MDILNLAFDWTVRPWQWAVITVAALALVAGVVMRQINRKKAGM